MDQLKIDPNLLLDEKCSSLSHPWSALGLAAPNAQLAGVLAGFMIVGVTTLLFNRSTSGRRVGHTVALFAAGTLVLGIDSYLFGSIYATAPVREATPNAAHIAQVCQNAWLQIMPAAGMLALGASLLAAGIGWMLTQHAVDNEYESKQHTTLGNILTGLVLGGTAALLAYTSWTYVDLMAGEFFRVSHDGVPELQANGSVVPSISDADRGNAHTVIKFILVSLYAILSIIILPKIYRLWRKMGDRPHWDQVLAPRHRSTEWIAGLAAFYVMASLFLTIILPNWSYISFVNFPALLETPLWPVREYVLTPRYRLWWSIAMCIGAPSLLFILIANSMPGPFGYWRLQRRRRRLAKELGLASNQLQRVPCKKLAPGAVVVEITTEHEYEVLGIADGEIDHVTLSLSCVSARMSDGRRSLAPAVLEEPYHLGYEFWIRTDVTARPPAGTPKDVSWQGVLGVLVLTTLTLWARLGGGNGSN